MRLVNEKMKDALIQHIANLEGQLRVAKAFLKTLDGNGSEYGRVRRSIKSVLPTLGKSFNANAVVKALETAGTPLPLSQVSAALSKLARVSNSGLTIELVGTGRRQTVYKFKAT